MLNFKFIEEFKGYSINEVDEISSTNTYLKENFLNYKDKYVLSAISQTNGRGRYNRVWQSKDDLCFSILIKELHNNSILTPLAVCLALKKLNIKCGIKWPNDIYIDNKKLCGILCEDIYSNKFEASIIGIGINKNNYDDVNGIGLSKFYDISNIELIKLILEQYDYLLHFDKESILELYNSYSIILNKQIIYKGIEYTVLGFDINCHLIVNNALETLTLSTDEISIKESLKEQL